MSKSISSRERSEQIKKKITKYLDDELRVKAVRRVLKQLKKKFPNFVSKRTINSLPTFDSDPEKNSGKLIRENFIEDIVEICIEHEIPNKKALEEILKPVAEINNNNAETFLKRKNQDQPVGLKTRRVSGEVVGTSRDCVILEPNIEFTRAMINEQSVEQRHRISLRNRRKVEKENRNRKELKAAEDQKRKDNQLKFDEDRKAREETQQMCNDKVIRVVNTLITTQTEFQKKMVQQNQRQNKQQMEQQSQFQYQHVELLRQQMEFSRQNAQQQMEISQKNAQNTSTALNAIQSVTSAIGESVKTGMEGMKSSVDAITKTVEDNKTMFKDTMESLKKTVETLSDQKKEELGKHEKKGESETKHIVPQASSSGGFSWFHPETITLREKIKKDLEGIDQIVEVVKPSEKMQTLIHILEELYLVTTDKLRFRKRKRTVIIVDDYTKVFRIRDMLDENNWPAVVVYGGNLVNEFKEKNVSIIVTKGVNINDSIDNADYVINYDYQNDVFSYGDMIERCINTERNDNESGFKTFTLITEDSKNVDQFIGLLGDTNQGRNISGQLLSVSTGSEVFYQEVVKKQLQKLCFNSV